MGGYLGGHHSERRLEAQKCNERIGFFFASLKIGTTRWERDTMMLHNAIPVSQSKMTCFSHHHTDFSIDWGVRKST
jgi:hypothetical protein